ncbi:MAG: c-type cytochrome [Anaerolineae bacterium]
MQVKVVIGTIAFMLTMIIMGFAALQEPTRLEEFTQAFTGRSIENGADIFDNNCATCHGINGKVEECYNTAGDSIGCKGFPLNVNSLVCGDKSARMTTLGWEGSKQAFIERTIAAGRSGTEMPAWSADFGGPMRGDQIADVAAFVLNWESEGLCSQPVVTFDWPASVDDFLAEYPDGDAVNGASLFLSPQPYGCSSCHGNPDGSVPAAVGPDLGAIGEAGATRVEGYTAAQYIYESIINPTAFIAPECPNGPCPPTSGMPPNFAARIGDNPQDMADLLAYLLGQ